MKLTATNQIEVSRRNLVALLFALDSGEHEPTLSRTDNGQFICIRAVQNDEHYGDRQPGWMPEAATTAMVVQA